MANELMHHSSLLRRYQGFTLIEVMIVVAIVGILSAIAYPSYAEYIRRGHRADARAGLLQAQQYLERASTATGVYPTTLPPALKWLLPDGTTPDPTKRYTIDFQAGNDNHRSDEQKIDDDIRRGEHNCSRLIEHIHADNHLNNPDHQSEEELRRDDEQHAVVRDSIDRHFAYDCPLHIANSPRPHPGPPPPGEHRERQKYGPMPPKREHGLLALHPEHQDRNANHR